MLLPSIFHKDSEDTERITNLCKITQLLKGLTKASRKRDTHWAQQQIPIHMKISNWAHLWVGGSCLLSRRQSDMFKELRVMKREKKEVYIRPIGEK